MKFLVVIACLLAGAVACEKKAEVVVDTPAAPADASGTTVVDAGVASDAG